jgi:DNA-binding CsgD family transcriptional regulator
MNTSKKTAPDSLPSCGCFQVHPKLFVFLDKRTGTRRFEVRANEDGSMPVDQAASLLAIQCIARHQSPREFVVMVQTDEDVAEGLAGRASKLIRTFADTKTAGAALSRRQREVLDGVTQNLTNKEIAARLNLSERTIKFHVSALLDKFDVSTRVDLLLKALAAPADAFRPQQAEFFAARAEQWRDRRATLRHTEGKVRETAVPHADTSHPLVPAPVNGTTGRPS